VVAETSHLLASVLAPYRAQLRVAEDEAAACPRSSAHLGALSAAGAGADPPSRSHPPGPWRVRAWQRDSAVVVARHESVDQAEGEVVARRTGDASVVCWAEPDLGPSPPPADAAAGGWRPRVDPARRQAAFAVEDAIASLCAGAAGGATGPDVLDVGLLCLLGQAALRSIHEYRTLMAAIWTDLEACPHVNDHEAGAAAGMEACTDQGPIGPAGPWRHLLLVRRETGPEPVVLSAHEGQAGASASVAVARAADDEGLHWTEPVVAGHRRGLADIAP
jgi:hypothetical protein